MATVLIAQALLACGQAPDRYVTEYGRNGDGAGTDFRYYGLAAEDTNGYQCDVEVYIQNVRSTACRIGFAALVTFRDGSQDGFGFVFDEIAPGETCEMYGNVGVPTSGDRYYPPDCSGVADVSFLYGWQSCDDGYRGESGDRERYYELTSQGQGGHGDYSDHAESY